MEQGWVTNNHRRRNPGRRDKNMERRKFEGKQRNSLKHWRKCYGRNTTKVRFQVRPRLRLFATASRPALKPTSPVQRAPESGQWSFFLTSPNLLLFSISSLLHFSFPFSLPLTLVALRTTIAAWPVLQWRPTHAQCVALIDRCEEAPAIWCSVTVYAVATGSYNVDCYITTWSGYLTNIAQWTRGLLAHHKQQ
jgi:hypothetical protein